MKASLEYIAAGGNRHPYAADWATSLLAFGSGNNIALWNPDDESHIGVTALLAGHSDCVNAVKIFHRHSRRHIISGAADKTIRIWTATEDTLSGFTESQCLTEHTGSVNAISGLNDADLFASGAADGTVKIWQFGDDGAVLTQTIQLKPRYFPLTLALATLSNGDSVLAVAGTLSIIQIFVRAKFEENFQLHATLSGHEGWIRSLDFARERDELNSDLLLASASQDKYIRLWRFHQRQKAIASPETNTVSDLAAAAEKKSLSNKAHEVGSSDQKYQVTFEALLIGHEDWIYTARWAPAGDGNSTPVLLSASADNSLSIWEAESASGLWVCTSRLGEISSQKGSTTATGSTGGFWIGLWQPQRQSIVSLGRTGSWRKWSHDPASDMWLQQVGISGHTEEVQSLAWSPSGTYLLSTGSDQTTRLLAEWHRENKSSWHEFSRPQIHGYDLNCVDAITENQFISGADEKLLRVFNKPKAVDNLLCKLTGSASTVNGELPDAANIPVLGLSNKAVTAVDDDEQVNGLANGDTDDREAVDPASVHHKSTLDLNHPPLEDHLARHTLWPEHEKLYGHGYEISAVATSNDGGLVATACKASSIDHAVIRLYETTEWREIKPPLTAHSLTATSLAFSPDDVYLLSVGRDRQWALFKKDETKPHSYTSCAVNPKGHSRMILDCSWAPQSAGHVFATAGRDKSVKIWKLVEGKVDCIATVTSGASVTAAAFSKAASNDTLQLAYGNEEGKIGLVELERNTGIVRSTQAVHPDLIPSKSVTALRWRPARRPEGPEHKPQLAVASDDYSVRIYNIA